MSWLRRGQTKKSKTVESDAEQVRDGWAGHTRERAQDMSFFRNTDT